MYFADDVDSPESIREEMKTMDWVEFDTPQYWLKAGRYVIADGVLGSLRAHLVSGRVPPGLIIDNCHVIGDVDYYELFCSK